MNVAAAIMAALTEQRRRDIERINPSRYMAEFAERCLRELDLVDSPLYWSPTAAYPSLLYPGREPQPWQTRFGRSSQWNWGAMDSPNSCNGTWREYPGSSD